MSQYSLQTLVKIIDSVVADFLNNVLWDDEKVVLLFKRMNCFPSIRASFLSRTGGSDREQGRDT